MSRRRGPVETREYAEMVARMIRAQGRRVATGDIEDLADLLALSKVLEEAQQGAVDALREGQGRSWSDIAKATGTTRGAAFQRFGPKAAPKPRQTGPDLLDELAAT